MESYLIVGGILLVMAATIGVVMVRLRVCQNTVNQVYLALSLATAGLLAIVAISNVAVSSAEVEARRYGACVAEASVAECGKLHIPTGAQISNCNVIDDETSRRQCFGALFGSSR
jgi:hypothetical protein